MRIKASIVVMSHLSDVQETLGHKNFINTNNNHINFAKYVMLECNGNLNQDVNANKLWEDFMETRFYRK